MPKKPIMENAIYDYVFKFFNERYDENVANRITRKKAESKNYPTIESIVELVLSDKQFCESCNYEKREIGQQSISRGTIRKAVKRLIAEGKIAPSKDSYELNPRMKESLSKHPILEIADKIDVTIGIPEDFVVLSVAPEYTASITRYLNAFFYNSDIFFIPFSSKILCISVFPEDVVTSSPQMSIKSSSIKLRDRIELALHNFNCKYPQFTYGHHYEYAYHTAHNPDIIAILEARAKELEKIRPYLSDTSIIRSSQDAACFFAENPYPGPSNSLSPNIDPETGLETGPLGYPSQEEWDLMDSPIMNEVDDEFSENY